MIAFAAVPTVSRHPQARPGSELPARDIAEIRVAENLAAPGCPLCWGRRAAEQRFVDAVIAEAVTDVGARRRLDAAGGYCARHTVMLPARERVRRGGTLGSAILLGSVLRGRLAALDALATTTGRHLRGRTAAFRQPPACPVCQDVTGSLGSLLTVVIGRLPDPAWADALTGAELCLDDLGVLWDAVGRSGGRAAEAWRPIAAAQAARLRAILATADRYVDHSGHDRQIEMTDEERTAVDQLVRVLASGPG